MSIEIKIRKNEPIDRALRRMKKKLDRENIIKGVRAKRYYEKPCEKRRRKEKVQAFTADASPPLRRIIFCQGFSFTGRSSSDARRRFCARWLGSTAYHGLILNETDGTSNRQ